MKIRVFLLLLCAWFSWSARAQQISVDDARNAARRFLQSGSPARRAKANMPLTLAYTASEGDKACFYVFNTPAEGSAYVIMGADEAAYEVLGYSDNGIFDYETAPANVRWWLSEYQRQIAKGMKQHVSARRQAPRRAASSFSTIAPLLKTQWNQSYPYNSEIPALVADPKSGGNLATGCVATAMAQVMYYHGCPAQGTGSKQYSKKIGNTTLVFSANFGATTYEWDKMQLSYNSNEQANEEANKAVATLMYHCGVSVDMDYGTINSGGSGASLADVPKALASYFGYDKSAMNRYKSSFSDEEWLQIIYDELNAARPVLYAGRTPTSGHAFVCDGYDATNAKWHFNWGWGGYCDGYYAINGSPALDPNGSGIGGAGEDAQYSGSQQIVVNVKPDEGGQYAYEMSWDYQTGLTATEVTRGETTSLTGHWVNTSLETIAGTVGVKTINMSTNDVAYRNCLNFSELPCGWYFDNNLSVPTTLLPPGQYSVQPVFRVAGGEWTPMVYGGTLPILTVKAPTSGVFLNPQP
ncbi:MAG: C10 family peptidase, partial [Bacteroidaceae bacterium]|nr:C10 family peptidase [Bacteroidaceae bacterium]